jgi:hypothetical protein
MSKPHLLSSAGRPLFTELPPANPLIVYGYGMSLCIPILVSTLAVATTTPVTVPDSHHFGLLVGLAFTVSLALHICVRVTE